MSTPYNQSLPMPGYQPTDLRTDPLGNPVRRGDTVTNVDMAGNPIPPQQYQPQQSGGYLIPPGIALQAKARAEEAQKPTATDFVAQDAAPPDYPPGSPELIPLYKLSFAKRADAMDAFAKLAKMKITADEGEENSLELVAAQYRALAEIDKFLATVAVDPDEYYRWIAGPGLVEATFGELWAAYQARMQPGEASSSSS